MQKGFIKILALILVMIMCSSLLSACKDNGGDGETTGSQNEQTQAPIESESEIESETEAVIEDDIPKIEILNNGKPAYNIIISKGSNHNNTELAERVFSALLLGTGKLFPIVEESKVQDPDGTNKEILIGETNRKESADAASKLVGEDDYRIEITEHKIVVVGGSDKALLNGVVTLISKYLGMGEYVQSDNGNQEYPQMSFPSPHCNLISKLSFQRQRSREAHGVKARVRGPSARRRRKASGNARKAYRSACRATRWS